MFIAAQKWTSIFKCLNYLRLVKNQLVAPWAPCLGLLQGRVWDYFIPVVRGGKLGRGQSGKGHCWVSRVSWDPLSWRSGPGQGQEFAVGFVRLSGRIQQDHWQCSEPLASIPESQKTRHRVKPFILCSLGPSRFQVETSRLIWTWSTIAILVPLKK